VIHSSTPDAASVRLAREIEHDRKIAARAEEIWNWDSPAGRRRADRRAAFFMEQAGLAPGRRALELGVGTGVFLERVATTGASIHALDLSADLLVKARARLQGAANVRFERGNAERMPFPDGCFDAVYGSSILHHLDLMRSLAEVRRVLRPGGRIVFAEPNIYNPQIAFTFIIGPRSYFGLSPDEMAFSRFYAREVLEKLGYVNISVRPFDFLHPAVPRPFVDRMARLFSSYRLWTVP
jgi:ubiquinone/menaquinone biosynthesis C-methylase UbiE